MTSTEALHIATKETNLVDDKHRDSKEINSLISKQDLLILKLEEKNKLIEFLKKDQIQLK